MAPNISRRCLSKKERTAKHPECHESERNREHDHRRDKDQRKFAHAAMERNIAPEYCGILRHIQGGPAQEGQAVDMVEPGHIECRPAQRGIKTETANNRSRHDTGHDEEEPCFALRYIAINCPGSHRFSSPISPAIRQV
jgi:hypothetical protein